MKMQKHAVPLALIRSKLGLCFCRTFLHFHPGPTEAGIGPLNLKSRVDCSSTSPLLKQGVFCIYASHCDLSKGVSPVDDHI